jgi:hypothetical protein
MDADLADQLRSMTMANAVTIDEEDEFYDGDDDDDDDTSTTEKGSATFSSSATVNAARSPRKPATDLVLEIVRPVAVNGEDEPATTAPSPVLLLTPPRIQRDTLFTDKISNKADQDVGESGTQETDSPGTERKLGLSFSSSSTSSNKKESIRSTPSLFENDSPCVSDDEHEHANEKSANPDHDDSGAAAAILDATEKRLLVLVVVESQDVGEEDSPPEQTQD